MADRRAVGEAPTPPSWVEALDGVLDSAVEREDVLELRAEGLSVGVPLRFGADAERAEWRFDGTVKVTVEGASGPLAEWLRWWYERTEGRPE